LSSFTVSLQAALHLPFIIKAAFKQSLKKPLTFPLKKKVNSPAFSLQAALHFPFRQPLKKALKRPYHFPLKSLKQPYIFPSSSPNISVSKKP